MLSKENYINAHTHQGQKENVLSVVNLYPADKSLIESGNYYSIGIHPWYIPEKGSGKMLMDLEETARREEVVAIGECGLDKLSTVPMDLQQFVFEKQMFKSGGIHGRIVELIVVAADFFGFIHRHISILNQRFYGIPISRELADPDAGSDGAVMPVQTEGLRNGIDDPLRNKGRILSPRDIRQDDHEFISSHTAHRIRIPYALKKPLRHLFQ